MATNQITVDILGVEYCADERLRQRALHLDSLMMFITTGADAFSGMDAPDREYVMEAVRDIAWEIRHLTELLSDSRQAA